MCCHVRGTGPIATSVSRTSSGSRSTPIYPPKDEPSPWSNRDKVTHPVGGAEKFDARPVGEEHLSELENLVVFGKGLRWCGAHSSKTSDEECRKPEAADLRGTSPTRIWRDE